MKPISKSEIKSIYAGIKNRRDLKLDLQGWNSEPPVLGDVIRELRPDVIIEVGVWKGASLCYMAGVCVAEKIDTLFFAVDIWFGFAGKMFGHPQKDYVPPRWDAPTNYQQFLYNIASAGHAERVVPVWDFTQWGAETLKKWDVVADLIYVDAGHDEASVYADLVAYWPLLRVGGAMIGDDFSGDHAGVRAGVIRFCEDRKLTYKDHGNNWEIRK